MEKTFLQPYAGGSIYKHRNGTYSVETPEGKGEGATVSDALRDYSDNIAALVMEEIDTKKPEKKVDKK